MRKLSVIFYKDKNDNSPVLEFVRNLPKNVTDKIFRAIFSLEEFGVGTHILGVKKLVGTSIWEVRILGKISIRVIFAVPVRDIVLVLHGFVKKSQKTPMKELKIAIERLTDWKARH